MEKASTIFKIMNYVIHYKTKIKKKESEKQKY